MFIKASNIFDREFLAVILVTLLWMFFARYELMKPEEKFPLFAPPLIALAGMLRPPYRVERRHGRTVGSAAVPRS